jgi:hypothetical protein
MITQHGRESATLPGNVLAVDKKKPAADKPTAGKSGAQDTGPKGAGLAFSPAPRDSKLQRERFFYDFRCHENQQLTAVILR